jgi:hypothetical protein
MLMVLSLNINNLTQLKMKKITFLIVSILLVSCKTSTTFYQVYKTKSETVKQSSNNTIAFEDSNCKIEYNLWENNGNAGFSFFNKSNEVIYLLLNDSFYVINGNAYDYYQNRVFVNSHTTTSQATSAVGFSTFGNSRLGLLPISTYGSKTISNNATNGIEITESKILAIPPGTSKSVSEFNINQTLYRDCDLLRYPSSKQTSSKSFSESSTPLKFYNSISYKIGEKETRIKVKNDFYVSEVTNLSEAEMMVFEKNKFCDQKGGASVRTFKDSSPDKFYVTYSKSQYDTWKY